MGCGSSNSGAVQEPQKHVQIPIPEVIFVLGGPGSGKGTQCEKMVNEYCFNHISTGDLLRKEQKKVGPDAEELNNLMKEGKLVPSDLLVKLILKEFQANGNTGRYLLDGFPRSLDNTKSWDKIIGKQANIKFLLMFECSFEVMEQRLIKRGETSGRADDNVETIKKRFETFRTETEPVIAHYKDQVKRINSEASPDDVHKQVTDVLTQNGVHKVKKPEVIFVLGGPGSGKGTQCDRIKKDYEYTHLSTGDLLRAELQSGSAEGKEMDALIKEGKLVPSEYLVQLIKREFLKRQLKGKYLLDGFPRSMDNLNAWNAIMKPFAEVKFLLFVECSFEVMEKRLLKRGETSGRSDDNAETIKKRFQTFEKETKPIVDYFKQNGNLVAINSEQHVDRVYSEVKRAFKKYNAAVRLDGTKVPKRQFVIFVLGGPGSGKGTQCEQIVKQYGFCHLSTGDLLREEVKKQSDIGKQCDKIMKEGKLVSSELLVKIIQKNLNGSNQRKFLLDGYPRNKENVDAWNKLLPDIKVKYLIYFDCPTEVMQQRLTKRSETSGMKDLLINIFIGRQDDNPESIKKRLEVFKQETEPIIKLYEEQGKVIKIDATKEVEEVFDQVKKVFEEKKLSK